MENAGSRAVPDQPKTRGKEGVEVPSSVSDSDGSHHESQAPDSEQIIPKLNHQKGLWRQWVSSIIASLSYFILGTSLGWPSPVLYRIEKEQNPVAFSRMDSTLMVSLFYAGNMIMPIPSGLLSDWVGRKASLLYLTVLPVASWGFSWIAVPKVMIHIARFLMGMYSGHALTVLPMYLGEIAEPQVRGKLGAILQLFVNIGLVFSYAVGANTSYGTFAIILGVFPIVHFFLIMFIPESPYWLTFKGKDTDAARRLAWLRGGDIRDEGIGTEVNVIHNSVKADAAKPRSFKMLFIDKRYRQALIIVEVISASQRFSGISALMPYISITVPMIPEHGLTANVCAIIVGTSFICGVLIALPLVDKLGRIPLLIASCIGCAVAMLSAAVWYYIFGQDIHGAPWRWVPLTVFCTYGICMNLGLGPIASVVQGELFPSHLKGKASAITVMVLSASSAIVNFTYIPIADSVGFWCNFLLFAVVCVACLIFTWTYAFETKGKTLQEIQDRPTK